MESRRPHRHVGLAGFLVGAFKDPMQVGNVARQIVYTAPTSNDGVVSLPDSVKADLRQLGLHHERISLTRVDSTGDVATTIVDLTPRVDNSPGSPALKVQDRAISVIDAKIAAIETTINSAKATTGSRALFAGLSRISFTSAPVTIISSGLDLVDPINFRVLAWTVPAQKVAGTVKTAGELPSLDGPVSFVVVPEAGNQPQLRAAQKNYRNDVWRALLIDSGATSVTFVEADDTSPSSGTPAPPVAVPDLPSTPIQPIKDPADPRKATCTVPAAYFVVNQAMLIDTTKTVADLSPCVATALAAGGTFELDGWTSYEGPLDAKGKPAIDSPDNRRLSIARVRRRPTTRGCTCGGALSWRSTRPPARRGICGKGPPSTTTTSPLPTSSPGSTSLPTASRPRSTPPSMTRRTSSRMLRSTSIRSPRTHCPSLPPNPEPTTRSQTRFDLSSGTTQRSSTMPARASTTTGARAQS